MPSLNHQNGRRGTAGHSKETEWRQNHCHGGSRFAVVAESRLPEWSLYACYWSKEAFLRGDHWPTTVHSLCNHGDAHASLLPRLSNLWATKLFGDLCATVLNTPKTPGRLWQGLNVLCTTFEQPFDLLWTSNDDLAKFMVAQGRHSGRGPCIKVFNTSFTLGMWPFCFSCATKLTRSPLEAPSRPLWWPMCLHSTTTTTLEPPWQWLCFLWATCSASTVVLVARGRHKGRGVAVTRKHDFLGLGDQWAPWSFFWSL